MPNMGYCKFQNTFNDLKECIDAIQNREEISSTERYYAEQLIMSMYQFLRDEYVIETHYEDIEKYVESIVALCKEDADEEEEEDAEEYSSYEAWEDEE